MTTPSPHTAHDTRHPLLEPYEQGLESDPRMPVNRQAATGRHGSPAHEVPAAAVEAAARDLFAWDVEEHDDPAPTWEDLNEAQRDVWRSGAQAALTAPLPFLRETWEAPIRALVDEFASFENYARSNDRGQTAFDKAARREADTWHEAAGRLRALLTSEATS